jgi:hypothetical protein
VAGDVLVRLNGSAIYTITTIPAFEDYPTSAAVQYSSGMQDIKYWASPDVIIRVQ